MPSPLPRPLCLAMVVACAGCTAIPISAPPVSVVATGPQAADRLDRLDRVQVRTFKQDGLARREVSGLPCRVSGTGYMARFTSPSELRLPLYLGRTDDAVVTCETPDGPVRRVVEVVNETAEEAEEGLTISTGSSGTEVRLGISIRDRDKDRFNYPFTVLVTF